MVVGAAGLLTCVLCAPASAQGPIADVSGKMTHVAGDLAKTVTGEPVQTRQKEIVKDLDDLIAALEKECQACKNGIKRNNPRQGLPDSVIRMGTGGIGDLVNPQEGNKDWAKISPRERDRIIQSMSEGFPPEYRLVLERYYRRLAEEKSVKAGAEATSPKADSAQSKATAPTTDGP
jgi:hypothetical protein